jgi:hypothetical protein
MLRSIEAHVPSNIYRDIIITYNKKEDDFFRKYLPLIRLRLKLVPEDDVYIKDGHNNGSYYSQIYSKFFPWMHSDADYFVHIDSDCVFNQAITRRDLVDDNGRVYVKRVQFSSMQDNHRIWQGGAEKLLNESVPEETMTGFPLVYPREAYRGLIQHVERAHAKPFLEVLKSMQEFNEFTPLGHYLISHLPGRWVDNELKSAKMIQQWSWGGLTPEAAVTCEIAIRS